MPLSAAGLASSIESELNSRLPNPAERGSASGDRQKLARAIAEAVVDHITGNAAVTGNCPPGTAGGPLTG